MHVGVLDRRACFEPYPVPLSSMPDQCVDARPVIDDCRATELDQVELDINIRSMAAQLQRRHHACKPCIRLPGPLVHVIIDPATCSNHHPLGRGHQYRIL